MNKPHKHRDVIIAWAEGKDVQFKIGDTWVEVPHNPNWDFGTEYRVKPETIEYRVALFKSCEDVYVCTFYFRDDESLWEKNSNFVRWLTPWTEVEV